MSGDSYYDVLGVPFNATKEQIKRAYRRLAKEHHPDSSTEGDSSRFRRAREAYETLSDDEARSRYDARMRTGGARRRTGPVHGDERGWGRTREQAWREEPGGVRSRSAPFERGFGPGFESEQGPFGGFESLDSLLRRFMSGMTGAHTDQASFDLVLSPTEARQGVIVPIDLADVFPGAGRHEEVRFTVPGNRRDGEILTGKVETESGRSFRIEFRIIVRG